MKVSVKGKGHNRDCRSLPKGVGLALKYMQISSNISRSLILTYGLSLSLTLKLTLTPPLTI